MEQPFWLQHGSQSFHRDRSKLRQYLLSHRILWDPDRVGDSSPEPDDELTSGPDAARTSTRALAAPGRILFRLEDILFDSDEDEDDEEENGEDSMSESNEDTSGSDNSDADEDDDDTWRERPKKVAGYCCQHATIPAIADLLLLVCHSLVCQDNTRGKSARQERLGSAANDDSRLLCAVFASSPLLSTDVCTLPCIDLNKLRTLELSKLRPAPSDEQLFEEVDV